MDLQFGEEPVSTKELTENFARKGFDCLKQQDAQEFSRLIMDELERTMMGTEIQSTIQKLFAGRMRSNLKFGDVEWNRENEETFYDIQLNVSGNKNSKYLYFQVIA